MRTVQPSPPAVRAPVALLLVEDDEGDALLVREELELATLPVEITWVRGIREAEAHLPADTDCVLLDLGLPDAHGLEAVHRVRAASPDTAVIVLTGLDDEQGGTDAVAAGAQDYLIKGQADGQLLARAIRYAIERRRAERSQQELRDAQLQAQENARLERGLLPTPLVGNRGVRVTSGYRAGRRRALLGGDFYDVVETPAGDLHAVIGDVCGHSADEAALGVALRIAWRTLVLGGREPDELLATMEQVLVHERHDDEIFATLASLTVAADRSRAAVRLAGHPPPVLLTDDGPRLLEAVVCPPVGLLGAPARPSTEIELPAGSGLLLYTDGLIEGRVAPGAVERLYTEGLVGLIGERLATGPPWRDQPRAFLESLIADVTQRNGEDLTDDLAVVLLTWDA